MTCVTQINTCMTHGANFQQDVELSVGYEDARTLGYVGTMDILDYEGGTVLQTITSPIDLENWMSFALTPAQTGALPPYNLVYNVSLTLPTSVIRLYEGDVLMNL